MPLSARSSPCVRLPVETSFFHHRQAPRGPSGRVRDCDWLRPLGPTQFLHSRSENGIDTQEMVWHSTSMTKLITIDRAGRVVIPKRVREDLRLQPGDTLELESSGDQVTLRPARTEPSLVREQGFWVYRTGKPLTGLSIIDQIDEAREERIRELSE